MAVIHSLVDNSEITHPSLKAFLHQRTRQWKYTDLSRDPTQCTELPGDYSGDVSGHIATKDTKPIRWNEELPRPRSLAEINKTLHRLAQDDASPTSDIGNVSSGEVDTEPEYTSGSVLCPTFAGGRESAGECVFTNSKVQHAILAFFDEVAQDPEHYRNPAFTTYSDIPRPTADAPFALSADPTVPNSTNVQPASPMMTPEQADLDEAREKLSDLRIALEACPDDVDELAKGRARLVLRITKQEVAIQKLQISALSSGSLRAGDAQDLRQDWTPRVDGQQVPFAGTVVDSELLRAAGLGETASEELEKLQIEEEKAFL
jgi:hypothetical protein